MSALAIKIIACVTMLIDHTAATLNMVGILPAGLLYEVMRAIGRIAFPLFCFQLVLGVRYTRNPWKYLLRLGLFALLSEIPFDFALWGKIYLNYQNVYFTLLIGFLATLVLKWAITLSGKKQILGFAAWVAAVALGAWIAESVLRTDYYGAGVIAIAIMSLSILPDETLTKVFGSVKLARILFFGAGVLALTFLCSLTEYFALFGIVFVWAYNEQRGYRGELVKWCGYAFYPVHLGILALVFVLPTLL